MNLYECDELQSTTTNMDIFTNSSHILIDRLIDFVRIFKMVCVVEFMGAFIHHIYRAPNDGGFFLLIQNTHTYVNHVPMRYSIE